METSRELEGKAALVTGAANGLGLAISEDLARRGASVLMTDISDKLEAACAKLQQDGLAVAPRSLDVRDPDAVAQAVGVAADLFGRLDILVCNAAMARSAKGILEMDEDWDATMSVNLRGTLNCIQAAGRFMVKQGQGGRIITIGSTAGLKPYTRRSHYCTSKAAIIHLTKVAGLELAEHAITANCVCPGQTLTENLKMMTGGGLGTAEAEEMKKRQAAIPLGPNEPRHIAAAVAYFASPAAGTTTGQVLAVEGGGLLVG